MQQSLELGYLGVEVADRDALGRFLGEVVGLVPGPPTTAGDTTWRNDGKVQRIVVAEGPRDDATHVGFTVRDAPALTAAAERLAAAGHPVTPGTEAERAERRVADLVHVAAPWGVRVELAHGLADADVPFASPRVPGGFLTRGMGFGHVVFATAAFDESHRFVIEGLGLAQSDWLETELAPGVELQVRFYHCNARHHSLALARAPFALPQALHHLMVETNDRDDVGRAFDRAWDAGVPIANGLGRHDNDGMFSFYAATPAGFQVEFGHGARVVGEGWDGNRRYDRISAWEHQPLTRG